MEIASSALAGDGTRLAPSFPIATTQTTPALEIIFTRAASAVEPLSPFPGSRGLLSTEP